MQSPSSTPLPAIKTPLQSYRVYDNVYRRKKIIMTMKTIITMTCIPGSSVTPISCHHKPDICLISVSGSHPSSKSQLPTSAIFPATWLSPGVPRRHCPPPLFAVAAFSSQLKVVRDRTLLHFDDAAFFVAVVGASQKLLAVVQRFLAFVRTPNNLNRSDLGQLKWNQTLMWKKFRNPSTAIKRENCSDYHFSDSKKSPSFLEISASEMTYILSGGVLNSE